MMRKVERRLARLALAIPAFAVAASALASPVAATGPNRSNRSAVVVTAQAGVGLMITVDPTRGSVTTKAVSGTMRITNANGRTSESVLRPMITTGKNTPAGVRAPASLTSYDCVVNTETASDFQGYTQPRLHVGQLVCQPVDVPFVFS